MNANQTILGIVLFVAFWAFQVGYVNSLGTSAWFLGSIIFVILLWAIGRSVMPKPSQEVKKFWMFVSAFAIVATFFISYLGPSLGAVFPPGFTPAVLTPLVLSLWLMVFGAAMFVGGWNSKDSIQTWIGVFWLFSALHFVTAVGTGPNSYLHFALVVCLPNIIAGLLAKK